MRIVYDNLADGAWFEQSGTSPALPAQNLATKERELVWRSALHTTSTTLTVNIDGQYGYAAQPIQCVILYRTNFKSGGWSVRIYDDRDKGALLYDSGSLALPPVLPFGDLNWGIDPLGKGVYTDWGYSNAILWLPTTIYGGYIEIDVSDTNDDDYLQVSRMFVGRYWEPAHAPKRGMQVQWVDTSVPQRTEGGTMHAEPGIQYRRLALDGDWLVEEDRVRLVDLIRKRGLRDDVFVSVFPTSGGLYERDHELQAMLGGIEPMVLPQYGYVNFAFLFEEI